MHVLLDKMHELELYSLFAPWTRDCHVSSPRVDRRREVAFQRAASSVEATVTWLQDHHFLTPEEMQPYKNLVSCHLRNT